MHDFSQRLPAVTYGSDIVPAVLAQEGIKQVAITPGASIRGIHESLVAFESMGGPEVTLCAHEEIAVGLAHGYAKTAGEPAAVALHDVVGLQHASMAIFNAWCDHVPVILLGGTGPMRESQRRPWIDWIHTAYLQGGLVRDYVKWDVQLFGLEAIESTLRRAIEVARTPPAGPVYVCLDVEDQEAKISDAAFEAVPHGRRGNAASLRPAPFELERLRRRLRSAEHPVLIVDCYNDRRDHSPIESLVQLSEMWALPVIDLGGRLNMPTQHPFCLSEDRVSLLADADFIICIDVRDIPAALGDCQETEREGWKPLPESATYIVSAIAETAPRSSWVPDDGGTVPIDEQIRAPGLSLVQALIESPVPEEDRAKVDQRAEGLRARRKDLDKKWTQQLTAQHSARPISTSRLCMELARVLGDQQPFVLSNSSFVAWAQRLWDLDGHIRAAIGRSGGEGLGYGLSASVGAALACKAQGSVAVDIQGDGDLLFVPSALWTAAAYELPLLVIVHNNRAYHQDRLHQQEMSGLRGRGQESERVGIEMVAPSVDFATLARSYGVFGQGPVESPEELGSTLERALAHVVANSAPALVDVLCAPR
jgi:acetolactate synthase-1/2/3 large subunit